MDINQQASELWWWLLLLFNLQSVLHLYFRVIFLGWFLLKDCICSESGEAFCHVHPWIRGLIKAEIRHGLFVPFFYILLFSKTVLFSVFTPLIFPSDLLRIWIKKKKAVNLQALAFKNEDFCLFMGLGPTSVTSGLFFHGFLRTRTLHWMLGCPLSLLPICGISPLALSWFLIS